MLIYNLLELFVVPLPTDGGPQRWDTVVGKGQSGCEKVPLGQDRGAGSLLDSLQGSSRLVSKAETVCKEAVGGRSGDRKQADFSLLLITVPVRGPLVG